MTPQEENNFMHQAFRNVIQKIIANAFLFCMIIAGTNLYKFAMLGEHIKSLYLIINIFFGVWFICFIKSEYIKTILRLALTPAMFLGFFISMSDQIKTQNSYIILGVLSALVFGGFILIMFRVEASK